MLRAFRVAAFSLAAAFTLSSPALAAPPTGDPAGPRAWSLWQSDGTAWLSLPATAERPADGTVLGWRFAATTDFESPAVEVPDFTALCGKTALPEGGKRVGLAIDFGDAELDAYPGDTPPQQVVTCVTGAADATALQLLAAAAKVKVEGETVTSVNGYPSRAQGADLPAPASASVAAPEASGVPAGWILGGAGALALLAGGAVVATRRRSRISA
ncbi:SCO2322 family protein [Nonomuraea sp. NPDC050310]|uniref:SCO2322 family protein n=1 Tax=Nonomuraea sp. NPDC050310 TaxID=3154935 RepID=UPI0033C02730